MVTIADVDARLTREAAGLHALESTTRQIARWRIDYFLDVRLALTAALREPV